MTAARRCHVTQASAIIRSGRRLFGIVLGVSLLLAAVLLALLTSGFVAAEGATPNLSSQSNFWSLQPVRPVAVPRPKAIAWVQNEVDAFILSKLEENGMAPMRPAGKAALLRRVYFDLIGLPPPPEEIERFISDRRPSAYEDLIDRLMASPQYGERWARHWLDVVRYADTGGFESDFSYEGAWRYRDYVIRSFNANKPFDRFVREQVAGDELWPDDSDAIDATALYAIGPVLNESAMVANQLEYEWLTDSADITGAAFLGVTFGCARCHDHKYDPISQRDYYGMQAIFAASARPYPEKTREQRIKFLNGLLAEKPLPKELEHDERCTLRTEQEIGTRLVHAKQPLDVHLLRRGELSKPADLVAPALPAALVSNKKGNSFSENPANQRRTALAQWLTSADANPLTARVIVNRIWSWHFGQGLVRTPNDFGAQGEQPTHPEFLDWLARDFAEHGWDIKRLNRLILLSNTYQMQSLPEETPARIDPENRLLSHFPRRRLEGEAVWDNLHACAGSLSYKQFGQPVVPPLTKDELTGLFDSGAKWQVTKDATEHGRRGVYVYVRRTFLFPLFDSFDAADVMASCPRRQETVVPAQALALFNSNLAAEQARVFAGRLLRECGDNTQTLLPRAWLIAYGRPITAVEQTRATEFLDRAQKETGSFAAALSELCLALFNANEFIYID